MKMVMREVEPDVEPDVMGQLAKHLSGILNNTGDCCWGSALAWLG